MRANPYLFAAYAATWIIHITYLAMIARHYSRLRREAGEVSREVNQ
jgi:hypothetical protein